MGLERLRLCDDVSPAQWLVDRLHAFAVDVGSIIPEGFDCYVRIFHPAERDEGDGTVAVRWSEVAEANGRVVHPEMQWPAIADRKPYSNKIHPGLWDRVPNEGSLPGEIIDALIGPLARHTTTPNEVWFAVWNGYGGLAFDSRITGWPVLSTKRPSIAESMRGRIRKFRAARQEAPAPTFELPGRAYYLLSGPIEAATDSLERRPFRQSANLWWPDDRAWCVATEIDFSWTYVGGNESLIDELLAVPALEVIRAELSHGVKSDSDHLNR
jgi:hypothetical protein